MMVSFIVEWIEQWDAQVEGCMNTNRKEARFTNRPAVSVTREPESEARICIAPSVLTHGTLAPDFPVGVPGQTRNYSSFSLLVRQVMSLVPRPAMMNNLPPCRKWPPQRTCRQEYRAGAGTSDPIMAWGLYMVPSRLPGH